MRDRGTLNKSLPHSTTLSLFCSACSGSSSPLAHLPHAHSLTLFHSFSSVQWLMFAAFISLWLIFLMLTGLFDYGWIPSE